MGFFDQFGSPTTLIFMLLVVAVSFILLMRTNRYFSRPRQDEPAWSRTARPHASSNSTDQSRSGGSSTGTTTRLSQVQNSSIEMDRWEVAMQETARELKAQIDSKMSALQALIADADRASARLEAALKNDSNVPSKYIRSGTPAKEENNWVGLPPNQAEALRPAASTASTASKTKYRQDEIYALADSGLSDSAIAQRVGMPIGEVELILSLRGER